MNFQRSTFNIQRSMKGRIQCFGFALCFSLEVQSWTFDVGCSFFKDVFVIVQKECSLSYTLMAVNFIKTLFIQLFQVYTLMARSLLYLKGNIEHNLNKE